MAQRKAEVLHSLGVHFYDGLGGAPHPVGSARLLLHSHLGEMDVPPLSSEAPRHQATAYDAVYDSEGCAVVENTGSRPHVQGRTEKEIVIHAADSVPAYGADVARAIRPGLFQR